MVLVRLAVLAALAAATALIVSRLLTGRGVRAGVAAALGAGALAGSGFLTGSGLGPPLLFLGLGTFMGVVDADGIRPGPVGSFLVGFFFPIFAATSVVT